MEENIDRVNGKIINDNVINKTINFKDFGLRGLRMRVRPLGLNSN